MSVNDADPATELKDRLENLNNHFTYLLYDSICRSLFERHKLLFAFSLAIKILQSFGKVDALEWRFLLSGQAPGASEKPNPNPSTEGGWIEKRCWGEICTLDGGLPAFVGLADDFAANENEWRTTIFDSGTPQDLAAARDEYGGPSISG